MKTPKPSRAYLITGGIASLISICILVSRDILSMTSALDVYQALCDAFFVPGVMLLSLGLLVLVSGTGQFDMLSYGMHSLLVLFTPLKKVEKHDSFYDFKMAREARRMGKPRQYLLHVGAVFVFLSVLCLCMYAMEGGL